MNQQIGVVIPTRNRAHLIVRAVRTVLAQSELLGTTMRLVVVDDGSNDDTIAQLAGIKDNRLLVIEQEGQGAAAARNRGVAALSTPFITFLDSDDEALPGWLSRLTSRLLASDSPDIVCCGYRAVHGRKAKEVVPRVSGPVLRGVTGLFTKAGVFALRRELFVEVGGYDPCLRSGQHSELAMRLVRARPDPPHVASLSEVLIQVSLHGGERIRGNWEARCDGPEYVLEKHPWLRVADPETWANYHAVAGLASLKLGKRGAARAHFAAAAAAYPRETKHAARWVVSLAPSTFTNRWGATAGRRL